MLNKTLKKIMTEQNSILQVSIGNEGAIVVYIKDNTIQQRFFVRTTSRHDTEKLSQILKEDKDVLVHIYLDTLDQTYLQRNIPFVYTFNSNKIAQQRISKEVPDDYLKMCIKIGQTGVGRKDLIYTFVSAPYEKPFSDWIDFFLYYHSTIEGIYFMPVELSRILPFLRGTRALERQSKPMWQNIFNLGSHNVHMGWEILITQCKASGFRQTVFYNGNIVLSRVLADITSDDPAVIAGNIELEVANSLEYLANVFMGFYDKHIDVYLLMSEEIYNNIRLAKVPKHTKIHTPYNFAKLVGVENSSEYDKFVDPFILAAFAETEDYVERVHIKASEHMYLARKYLMRLKISINALLVMCTLIIFSNFYSILNHEVEIFDYKNYIQQTKWDIEETKHKISELYNHTVLGAPINRILEIIDVHNFFNQNELSSINALSLISTSIPNDIRVHTIKWQLTDPILTNIVPTFQINELHHYRIDILMSGHFKNAKENQDMYYNNFKAEIKNHFQEYDTSFSPLLYDNIGEGANKYATFNSKIFFNSHNMKE